MQQRQLLAAIAISGALAVALGAFAAHGLAATVSAIRLGQWQTAVSYQFVHTLALAILLVAPITAAQRRLAASLFGAGLVLFCGSLYLLVLLDQPKFGMVAPLGGSAFIGGWLTLLYGARRGQPEERSSGE